MKKEASVHLNRLPILLLALSSAGAGSADAAPPGDEAAREIARLRSDSFEEREAARARLLALGTDDPERTLPLLAQAETDSDPDLAATAQDLARGIRWLARRRKSVALAGNDPDFRKAVEDLYDAMGAWRDPATRLEAAVTDDDASDLQAIHRIVAKGWMHPVACVAVLSDFADHESVQVRSNVVSVLGTLKHPAAGPAIARALADESVFVRKSAFFAAEQCRPREAVPVLLDMLEKSAEDLASGVIPNTLAAIGDVSAVPRLRAVAGTNTVGGAGACAALAHLADPDAIEPFLKEAAGNQDAFNLKRDTARGALKLLSLRRRLPEYLSDLDSPDGAKRLSALQHLGYKLRARQAVPEVLARMEKWDAESQREAIVLARDLGKPSDAQAILPYLARAPGRENIAVMARAAICQLRSPEILPALAALLDEPARAEGAAATLEALAGESWPGAAAAKITQAKTWWERRSRIAN